MANAALENGVFELKLKAARRPDTALGCKSTSEHGAAVRKSRAAKAALDQFRDREHAVECAFLVQHPRAVDPGMRTQDHLIPVTDDLLEFPQHGRDRLVAHLLGDRDAVSLHLAVGVVGGGADKDAALPADQHELDLPARFRAADFDAVF